MVIISRGILEHNILLWYHHSMHGEQEQYYGDFFFVFVFGCSKAPGENLSGRFARLPHRCGVLGGHHGRIRTPPTSSCVQECV